jgi:serine/threonine-protein kinase
MSPEEQPSGLEAGVVLDGRYRIERALGFGGMGAVYAAADVRLDKRVAVKVMARELTANPEALARFHREARVTSGLGHPHIVQVFDFSTTPTGEPFLVMEFLEGEDLDHRIRRLGQLSAGSVVHIVKQVASALAATHAKAIVHRDLKPGNIYLLEATGELDFVKVLDFGISKVCTATTQLTRTAAVMGTPSYMSPEQAKGEVDEIDESTDQWALACIAWECLSGERPFVGENLPSVLFQVVHQAPPPFAPQVGVGPEVEKVLLRALAKDKRQRFPSVTDFAAALEIAVSAMPVESQSPPRTVLLSDQAIVARKGTIPNTTFSRSAGELDASVATPRTKGRALLLGAGLTVGLAVATVLILSLRPGRVVEPRANIPPPPSASLVAPPPAAVPPPSAGAPPQAPTMDLPAPAEAPARAKPTKRKATTTKAKAAPQDSSTRPPQEPTPPSSRKESEDRWRVD